MKLTRTTWIGIAAMAIVAIAVGAILIAMLSAPSRRIVELEKPKPIADAQAAVDVRIAAVRKSGEPLLVGEFAAKPVPPDQDAAIPLQAAIKLLDTKEVDAEPFWDLPNDVPLTAEQRQICDAAMTKFVPVFALIDQADGRSGADWKVRYQSPAIRILLPALQGIRQMENLLASAIQSAHHAGRHDEAIHRLSQMVMLVHQAKIHPAMVGHLVGCGCAQMARNSTSLLIPSLKIGPAAGEAPPEKVAALIALMLDPDTLENGFCDTAIDERMFIYDTFQCLIDGRLKYSDIGPPKSAGEPLPTAPPSALISDLALILDRCAKTITASKTDRLPEFRKNMPPFAATLTEEARAMSAPYDKFANSHFAALANLRISAAALAVRWYAAEHGGAMPASLADLVPKYLPKVPGDPLTAAPAVLQFRGAPDPTVFSNSAAPGVRAGTKPAEVAIHLSAR